MRTADDDAGAAGPHRFWPRRGGKPSSSAALAVLRALAFVAAGVAVACASSVAHASDVTTPGAATKAESLTVSVASAIAVVAAAISTTWRVSRLVTTQERVDKTVATIAANQDRNRHCLHRLDRRLLRVEIKLGCDDSASVEDAAKDHG